MAQAPRCTWQRTGCAQAAPPAPPPPPPAGHKYTVGEAKFYGTNLLCELDAPNEVRPLYHYPVPVYSDLLLRLLDWSLAPVLHRRADTDAVLLPTCPAEPVAGESFYHAAYGRRRHQWDLTHHSAWLGVPSLPWKRLVGHECHRCDLSENSVSESKCCELTVFLRWVLRGAHRELRRLRPWTTRAGDERYGLGCGQLPGLLCRLQWYPRGRWRGSHA